MNACLPGMAGGRHKSNRGALSARLDLILRDLKFELAAGKFNMTEDR